MCVCNGNRDGWTVLVPTVECPDYAFRSMYLKYLSKVAPPFITSADVSRTRVPLSHKRDDEPRAPTAQPCLATLPFAAALTTRRSFWAVGTYEAWQKY